REPLQARRGRRPADHLDHGHDAGEPDPHAHLRGPAARLAADARELHPRAPRAAAARSPRAVAVQPVQALRTDRRSKLLRRTSALARQMSITYTARAHAGP